MSQPSATFYNRRNSHLASSERDPSPLDFLFVGACIFHRIAQKLSTVPGLIRLLCDPLPKEFGSRSPPFVHAGQDLASADECQVLKDDFWWKPCKTGNCLDNHHAVSSFVELCKRHRADHAASYPGISPQSVYISAKARAQALELCLDHLFHSWDSPDLSTVNCNNPNKTPINP